MGDANANSSFLTSYNLNACIELQRLIDKWYMKMVIKAQIEIQICTNDAAAFENSTNGVWPYKKTLGEKVKYVYIFNTFTPWCTFKLTEEKMQATSKP